MNAFALGVAGAALILSGWNLMAGRGFLNSSAAALDEAAATLANGQVPEAPSPHPGRAPSSVSN